MRIQFRKSFEKRTDGADTRELGIKTTACTTCTLSSCMTSSTARKLPAAASAVLDRLVLSIGTFNIACDGIQADRNPQTERTFRDAFAQVRDEMEGVNKLKTQYPELEDAATLAVNNHANKFASKILLQ